MHPDVPGWARDVLRRELLDVDLESFQVLKDSPVRKLGIGHSARGTFVVAKGLAGDEIFRVDAPTPDDGARTATCRGCGTTFEYEAREQPSRLHCVSCGALVAAAAEPRQPLNGSHAAADALVGGA